MGKCTRALTLETLLQAQTCCHGEEEDTCVQQGTDFGDLVAGPDFVAISFYKMMGTPTGLGALLIRRDSAWQLDKRSFAGYVYVCVCVCVCICAYIHTYVGRTN